LYSRFKQLLHPKEPVERGGDGVSTCLREAEAASLRRLEGRSAAIAELRKYP
jgi:hypothetical protein